MAEIEQIEAHIENTRDHLGSNLQELERRVESAADWKHHFRTRPVTLLTAAFAGGVLLAAVLGGDKLKGEPSGDHVRVRPAFGPERDKVAEAWDNIKAALLGVATTRLTSYVAELVPGFDEQYRIHEGKARSFRSDVR